MCQFEKANEVYNRALELCKRVGDDCRASMVFAKLCALATTRGRYNEAIELGLQSLDHGRRALNQPDLLMSIFHLADAYMLTGQQDKVLRCLQHAREWMQPVRHWYTNVCYLMESASFALMLGNVSHALELIASVEQATGGRESGVGDPAMHAKLRAFRAAHVYSDEAAWSIVREVKDRFRGRHPFYHFNIIGVTAWLERRCNGVYSAETHEELRLFERLGAPGKRAILKAQGFLD
jgi:tetratricopeptide (TPR) repeat protein